MSLRRQLRKNVSAVVLPPDIAAIIGNAAAPHVEVKRRGKVVGYRPVRLVVEGANTQEDPNGPGHQDP